MSDSDVVIRVEGLGKSYAVHHEQREDYTALRDVVARKAKAAGRLLNPFTLAGQLRKTQREAAQKREASEEEFWALKDVCFEISRGERVGIIGRNGAGKSTLLKILSRITEPTTGRVEIRGRVASLLEVGTGFHPELTGRENIYLNGAILGMTRREIRSKFDEILDFAEVEKFLDTPVKRYSSGMYVRLAFAVAAHLEPEILLVDEVLAVGDLRFREKCINKMKKLSSEEMTIVFVSHSIESLNSFCDSAILLSKGEVSMIGEIRTVTSTYIGNLDNGDKGLLEWKIPVDAKLNLKNIVDDIGFMVTSKGRTSDSVLYKSTNYAVQISAVVLEANPYLYFFIAYYTMAGDLIMVSSSYEQPVNFDKFQPGPIRLEAPLPIWIFNSGRYLIEVSCVVHRHGWILPPQQGHGMTFEVIDDVPSLVNPDLSYYHPFSGSKQPGILSMRLPWTLTKAGDLTNDSPQRRPP